MMVGLMGGGAEMFKGIHGAAGVDGVSGLSPAVLHRGGDACDGEGGGGVELDDLAFRSTLGAIQYRKKDSGVGLGITTEEVVGRGGGQFKIGRVDLELSNTRFFHCEDLGFSKRRNLIEPQSIGAGSMDRPRALAAEFLEDPGVGRQERGTVNAGELELRADGI